VTRRVADIKAEHSLKTATIMNSYLDVKDEIRQTRQPQAGAYLERLSGEQRMAALREQAVEKATLAHESTLKAYAAEVERYHSEIARRRGHLKGRLFKVDDAGALARAALATDTELGVLLELAGRPLVTPSWGAQRSWLQSKEDSESLWLPTSITLLPRPAASTRSGHSCPTKAPCKESVMT
jgi:hypothetical protein